MDFARPGRPPRLGGAFARVRGHFLPDMAIF